MRLKPTLITRYVSIILLELLCGGEILLCKTTTTTTTKETFRNLWAVKIDGNIERAKQIAFEYGYDHVEKLEDFGNIYIMKRINYPKIIVKRQISNLTNKLDEDPYVIWAEQQLANVRVKRDSSPELSSSNAPNNETSIFEPITKTLRNFITQTRQFVFSLANKNIGQSHMFNDELWPYQMWYLHNPGFNRFDHGVTKVWEMGYTGKGVVVAVLDDGLEWKHPDLRTNYDHNASYDMNDDDVDPSPRYDIHNTNGHGTRCAGEIAMTPHNQVCGVGVAYNAKIGGIRCLDGEISDLVEARSLSFKSNYIDIYSSSWGPNDDGLTVDGPKKLALEAIERNIRFGRKGRGSIYVWASGNGGSKGDNCNCDGYVSSIYTISIGSVSESGQFPWYGERCASTLAVAFSSGAYNDKKIATTDIHSTCTTEHSGTSAAAPIAAGIFALLLEANPTLTWRDVQHLVVCTSEFSPLADNKGWKKNDAGFLYNSRFGFGLLMADALVKTALSWENVPEKFTCVIKSENLFPVRIDDGVAIKVLFVNKNTESCPIKYLEHVQVRITMGTSRRGNMRVFLFSAKDTPTVLLHPRFKDISMEGFNNWNLTSVHYWGENPQGSWRLYVQNSQRDGSMATLSRAELILHGMAVPGGCFRGQPHRRYINEELISRIIDRNLGYSDESALVTSSWFGNTFNPLFDD